MLLAFFVLTYLMAWAFWWSADAVSRSAGPAGPTLSMLRTPLFLIGTFAPSIVALALTARREGRAGAAALFGRIVAGRVRARWVGFAVTWMAAIKLTAALIHRLATGAWPRFGPDTAGQSFPLYLLQVVAVSVAMAWLYGHTRGSLLMVMLLHAAINNTKDIVPSAVPGAGNPFALSTSLLAWITVGLLWACAAVFLARMPRWDATWTPSPGAPPAG